jgi:uncharacterized protein (TIGR00297 family)
MITDWFWGCCFFTCLVALIYIAELVRKHTNNSPEVTRKVVHITTGIFVAFTPMFFSSSLPMLIIAGAFGIVNFFAIQKGKLTSYNGSNRLSYGTVYYPIAFFVLTALFWRHSKLILITSMLILALSDAFAAIIGKSVKHPIVFRLGGEKKSVQGSTAMFVMTMIIILVFWSGYFFPTESDITWSSLIWMAALTALIATVCEAISFCGSDNLTVPVGVAFIMHLVVFRPELLQSFMVGAAMAAVVAACSYKLRFLSENGAIATFLLGAVVFGIGGWKFALPILSFFILSSVLSKLGKRKKAIEANTFEKSSRRDMWQVWANGGVAGTIVLLYYLYPHPSWFYIYLASVAAATADTWGTELGVFSKSNPRHILTFRRVPTGTSGGISLLGTIGGLIGSFFIAAHLWLNQSGILLVFLITLAGLLGSVLDSIIGAAVQAQYKCPRCGKCTEKIYHCNGIPTVLHSGYTWINNDFVNMTCTSSAALIMWLFLCL